MRFFRPITNFIGITPPERNPDFPSWLQAYRTYNDGVLTTLLLTGVNLISNTVLRNTFGVEVPITPIVLAFMGMKIGREVWRKLAATPAPQGVPAQNNNLKKHLLHTVGLLGTLQAGRSANILTGVPVESMIYMLGGLAQLSDMAFKLIDGAQQRHAQRLS